MNVLVSGASGLIGARLCGVLRSGQHTVTPLIRGENWNVATGEVRVDAPFDAVVHLAGANVASCRWSEGRKRELYESRVPATQKLAMFLATQPQKPRVFFCASAVGYYGSRGDEPLSETDSAGDDFLARLCQDWEEASSPLTEVGCRVVHGRFGIVLSTEGGALARMLPFFRKGLGGPLGDGKHWMSWITLNHVVRQIIFLLERDVAVGAFNLVSPNPVRNAEFTQTLGKVLRRPAKISAPRLALKAAFGEMADVALLASQQAYPRRLEALRFRFDNPELEPALRHVLEHGA